MNENAKLNRLLALIILLLGPRYYTREEVQERFNISKSTFHRHIRLLRDNGIIVHFENGLYHIQKFHPELNEISELLHFSKEEAQILNKAINSIDDHNLLKPTLISKLNSIYSFVRIPKTITHPRLSEIIEVIIKAIKSKKQLKVIEYQSANSQKCDNRMLEVFQFTCNYQMIWAWDIKSKKNKLYKVSRIGDVILTDREWKHRRQHKSLPYDVFNMTGEKAIHCKLKLSMRAGNLLMEEYPEAEEYLTKLDNDTYLFNHQIYHLHGVSRFCMGLINEIEIIEPLALHNYIESCLKKHLNKKVKVSS